MRKPVAWRSIASAVIISMLDLGQPDAYAQNVKSEQKPESQSPQRQAETMARIIDASLDSVNIGQWEGVGRGIPSPFNPAVSGDYVPTVGVIIKLRVSFPLVEPEGAPAAKTDSSASEDLWEKFSNASPRAGLAGPAGTGSFPLDPNLPGGMNKEVEVETTVVEKKQSEEEGPVSVAPGVVGANVPVRPPAVSREERLELNLGDGGLAVGANPIALPAFDPVPTAPYSKERVSKLKDTIVDAVAKYAHRMTTLKPEDRLLIIVEAPGVPQVTMVKTSRGSGDERTLLLASDAKNQSSHLLLCVPQPAIAAQTDREQLTPKIVEITY